MRAAFASLAVWSSLLGISKSFRMTVVGASANLKVMLQDTETTQTGSATALALVAGDSQSLLENHSGHIYHQRHRRNLSNSLHPGWATPEDYNEQLGFDKIMRDKLKLIMFPKGGSAVVFTISHRIGKGDVFLVSCVNSSKKRDRHLRYLALSSVKAEVDALRKLSPSQYIPALVADGAIFGRPASLPPASVITAHDPPPSGRVYCLPCLSRANPKQAGNISGPNCFNDCVEVTPGPAVLMTVASGSPLLTCNNLAFGERILNSKFDPKRHSETIERQLLRFKDELLASEYLHGALQPGNVHWDEKRKQITVLDFGAAKKESAEDNAEEEMYRFLWRLSHSPISTPGVVWKAEGRDPFLGIGLELSSQTKIRLEQKEWRRAEQFTYITKGGSLQRPVRTDLAHASGAAVDAVRDDNEVIMQRGSRPRPDPIESAHASSPEVSHGNKGRLHSVVKSAWMLATGQRQASSEELKAQTARAWSSALAREALSKNTKEQTKQHAILKRVAKAV